MSSFLLLLLLNLIWWRLQCVSWQEPKSKKHLTESCRESLLFNAGSDSLGAGSLCRLGSLASTVIPHLLIRHVLKIYSSSQNSLLSWFGFNGSRVLPHLDRSQSTRLSQSQYLLCAWGISHLRIWQPSSFSLPPLGNPDFYSVCCCCWRHLLRRLSSSESRLTLKIGEPDFYPGPDFLQLTSLVPLASLLPYILHAVCSVSVLAALADLYPNLVTILTDWLCWI